MIEDFFGSLCFGEGILLKRDLRPAWNVSDVPGCTRLGRTHHLPSCPLPPGGDGGNPGIWRLCRAFLNTESPRLPWLSWSAKTQQLTKKAIHRLTGGLFSIYLLSNRIPCSKFNAQAWPNSCQGGQHWKIPHGSSGLNWSHHFADDSVSNPVLHSLSGLCCMPGLLCGQADNNPREKPWRIPLPSSRSCPGGNFQDISSPTK